MRNNIRGYIITGLFFLIPLAAICQQRPPSRYVDSAITSPDALKVNCGVDILLKELRKNADFVERERKMNDAIQKHVNGGPTDPVLTLPVVVHIINTNPNSISDADVANGIKDLNDAYSKLGNYAASTGADTRIQFVLARKDSLGGLTTGIDRVTSYFGSDMNMNLEDSRMKSLIQWDPNDISTSGW